MKIAAAARTHLSPLVSTLENVIPFFVRKSLSLGIVLDELQLRMQRGHVSEKIERMNYVG